MSSRDHWEQVYASKPVDRLGWYAQHLRTSLDWIAELALPEEAPVIDVGCGASTLVDDLLDRGYRSITALDISEHAQSTLSQRLGVRSVAVTWLCADIVRTELPGNAYELWHDRAVFHFLTEARDRQAYRHNLSRALKPGGHVIIGVFSPEAPPTCSGLPVERYEAGQLAAELGSRFSLVKSRKKLHVTPGGVEQMYLYCLFKKTDKSGQAGKTI